MILADFFFVGRIKNNHLIDFQLYGLSTASTTLMPFLLAIFITKTTSSIGTFFSALKTNEGVFIDDKVKTILSSKLLFSIASLAFLTPGIKDNIPFIPLPSSVTTSDKVLPLNEIQSIRILGEDEQLISMAQNFKSFWKNHTQDELQISHGQMSEDNTITLMMEELDPCSNS